MSESKNIREGDHRSPATPPDSDGVSGVTNRIPSRLWFPAGFVGFFFILGGWNQISSSWAESSSRSTLESGLNLGLISGSIVFAFCTTLGLRAWWRERRERRLAEDSQTHWRDDLRKHSDDIRFP